MRLRTLVNTCASAILAASCASSAVPAAKSTAAAPTPTAGVTAPVVTARPAAASPEKSADFVDHEGDSTVTAVPVPANAPDDGIPFENNWIFDRFGKFRRLGGGTGSLEGRRYDVVDIELWGGEKKKVYFDITENWNAWKLPTLPAPPK